MSSPASRPSSSSSRSPIWLRALGGAVIVLMALGMAWALGIALTRFGEIGV